MIVGMLMMVNKEDAVSRSFDDVLAGFCKFTPALVVFLDPGRYPRQAGTVTAGADQALVS